MSDRLNLMLSKEKAQERFDICKKCDKFEPTAAKCKECGCFMKVKVKFGIFSCPLKKW